jgi:hypothetical protein
LSDFGSWIHGFHGPIGAPFSTIVSNPLKFFSMPSRMFSQRERCSAGTISGRRIRYLLSGSPGQTVGFRGRAACKWGDANLCRAGKSKREAANLQSQKSSQLISNLSLESVMELRSRDASVCFEALTSEI